MATTGTLVGEVNGQPIPFTSFQQELQNYIRNEEARTGKPPEGQQLVQMREGLFQYKVQQILMDQIKADYHLTATVEEMQNYLLKNPQELAQAIARFEGPDRVPAFLQDSTPDENRYRAWLAQDSVYDRISLRFMEQQLSTTVIPQLQLQHLLAASVHTTGLEESFRLRQREIKARLSYYSLPLDSIVVDSTELNEAALKAHFEAQPDSFYYPQPAARLKYVSLPIQPSSADTTLLLDFAKQLKAKALDGEKFSELAASYSNDPGSAENGGKLGGFQSRESWVPEFSEAAFALEPGGISDPVLTQFGIHIIQMHEKKMEDSVEKVDASHILLRITAGTETVDSLMADAETLREDAKKLGLTQAAEARKLELKTTPVFDKDNYAPLGAYVQGIHAFAFSTYEKNEKVSETLQSENSIYLLERDAAFTPGRDFERARIDISSSLSLIKKQTAAAAELKGLLSQIQSLKVGDSLPPTVGRAHLDTTALIPAESWVPGFGYASLQLAQAFSQEKGVWGDVLISTQAAVTARVEEKSTLDDESVAQQAADIAAQSDAYSVNNLYQKWAGEFSKSAKVENTLDLVFRN
jgi:parvulin-like peptidyl-prolyl isomerase